MFGHGKQNISRIDKDSKISLFKQEMSLGLDSVRDLILMAAIFGGLVWALIHYAIVAEFGAFTLINVLYAVVGVVSLAGFIELVFVGDHDAIYNFFAGIGLMYSGAILVLNYARVVISPNVYLVYAGFLFVWGILEIAQRREDG